MLKVIYSFVCEGVLPKKTSEDNYDISVMNIFDKRGFVKFPTVLNGEINFVVGVIGEPEDEGEEVNIRVRGKEVSFDGHPFIFEFSDYDSTSIYNVGFSDFPVTIEGTVYFEVVHKGKVLSRYPVRFVLKEEE